MTDETTDNTAAKYLQAHPRMIGALFALLLVMSQAGTVAGGCACPGP